MAAARIATAAEAAEAASAAAAAAAAVWPAKRPVVLEDGEQAGTEAGILPAVTCPAALPPATTDTPSAIAPAAHGALGRVVCSKEVTRRREAQERPRVPPLATAAAVLCGFA